MYRYIYVFIKYLSYGMRLQRRNFHIRVRYTSSLHQILYNQQNFIEMLRFLKKFYKELYVGTVPCIRDTK